MDRRITPTPGSGKPIGLRDIGSRSRCVAHEDLDKEMRHGVRVMADRVDVLVGQIPRLVAEQLTATSDGKHVRNGVDLDDVVHRVIRDDVRVRSH